MKIVGLPFQLLNAAEPVISYAVSCSGVELAQRREKVLASLVKTKLLFRFGRASLTQRRSVTTTRLRLLCHLALIDPEGADLFAPQPV